MKNLNIGDDENWILVGDFNFYRSLDDRNRPSENIQDTFIFNDAIVQLGLIELPLKGRSYTWSNMQQDPLLEQLDWFFSSVNWTTTYQNTSVHPMTKHISDHIPCKIMIGSHIPKSRIFRFENFWYDHPGFIDTVKQSWFSPGQVRNNSAATLSLKLKNLRHSLKNWSRSLSKLNSLVDLCNKVIFFLDSLEECRSLFLTEWNFRTIIKAKLLHLLRCRNIYWKQRHTVNRVKFGDESIGSKDTVNRVKFGDECTKYFHAMATLSFRRNYIPQLLDDSGSFVSNHESKAALI